MKFESGERLEANPFYKYPHFLEDSQQQRFSGDMYCHPQKIKSGSMAPEQVHMWEQHFVAVVISDKRAAVEYMELRSSIQHNASPQKHSRTTPTVSFRDDRGKKPCSYTSPYQLALKIFAQTETILIRKQNVTPLMRSPVLTPL
ncbi:hypothetical protein TNCV_1856431 [Trichonephila clavipes]|nr:hypothetical protein TNCV_1856431 [Trichonephila clavipes]